MVTFLVIKYLKYIRYLFAPFVFAISSAVAVQTNIISFTSLRSGKSGCDFDFSNILWCYNGEITNKITDMN